MDVHGFVMPSGRHEGTRITRIPISYLKWMVREGHTLAHYAKAELERRGTVTPEIEISGHAIDSASLRIRKIWHQSSNPNEGLHAWLCRLAPLALKDGERMDGKIRYGGVLWVFGEDGEWPILKTVMIDKSKKGVET